MYTYVEREREIVYACIQKAGAGRQPGRTQGAQNHAGHEAAEPR